jgi:hypothetical protein
LRSIQVATCLRNSSARLKGFVVRLRNRGGESLISFHDVDHGLNAAMIAWHLTDWAVFGDERCGSRGAIGLVPSCRKPSPIQAWAEHVRNTRRSPPPALLISLGKSGKGSTRTQPARRGHHDCGGCDLHRLHCSPFSCSAACLCIVPKLPIAQGRAAERLASSRQPEGVLCEALKFCRREEPFNQSLAQQPQRCARVPFSRQAVTFSCSSRRSQ